MVYVFLVGCAVGCAYFVYKVRRASLFSKDEDVLTDNAAQLFIIYRDRQTDYQLVFKSLTVFGASFTRRRGLAGQAKLIPATSSQPLSASLRCW